MRCLISCRNPTSPEKKGEVLAQAKRMWGLPFEMSLDVAIVYCDYNYVFLNGTHCLKRFFQEGIKGDCVPGG